MLTLTCSIRMRNGALLIAQASAATPLDDVEIYYRGTLSLFPGRPEKCPIMVMRYLLQIEADRLRGEFSESSEGRFDAER